MHIVYRMVFATLLTVLLTTSDPSCAAPPSSGNGSGAGTSNDKGNESLDCDVSASIPYGVEGPDPDWRPGFYAFTSEAAGDVNCTGTVAEIKVTVVYQHETDGSQGAVTGRDHICEHRSSCSGSAQYRRQRLNCNEVYYYDDYTHVTGWFKRTASSPEVRVSGESKHKTGTSHNPFYPCRSK